MNVQIRSKDITLNDSTKLHVQGAIDAFEKYSLEITTINVDIKKEKQGVNVEFDIHIAHNTPVVINQSDDSLDAAIDLAIDRASKALRRLHDKITDHKKTGVKDLEVADAE